MIKYISRYVSLAIPLLSASCFSFPSGPRFSDASVTLTEPDKAALYFYAPPCGPPHFLQKTRGPQFHAAYIDTDGPMTAPDTGYQVRFISPGPHTILPLEPEIVRSRRLDNGVGLSFIAEAGRLYFIKPGRFVGAYFKGFIASSYTELYDIAMVVDEEIARGEIAQCRLYQE